MERNTNKKNYIQICLYLLNPIFKIQNYKLLKKTSLSTKVPTKKSLVYNIHRAKQVFLKIIRLISADKKQTQIIFN